MSSSSGGSLPDCQGLATYKSAQGQQLTRGRVSSQSFNQPTRGGSGDLFEVGESHQRINGIPWDPAHCWALNERHEIQGQGTWDKGGLGKGGLGKGDLDKDVLGQR